MIITIIINELKHFVQNVTETANALQIIEKFVFSLC
jgi:hypothetical protein